ncbi:MAG: metallophosphoesterase [Saprospiraceae bacterium]|nr:metallophosphoesterase [Saprospiraceae bacterium]
MQNSIIVLFFLFFFIKTEGQPVRVPASYSNIGQDSAGIYFQKSDKKYYASSEAPKYSLKQLFGNPKGTESGLEMDFGSFEGNVIYGLIPYNQIKHPLPIFRFTKEIKEGKIDINIISDFKYPYDFVGWKENEKLTLGYRLIDKKGLIVYDGEVSVKGKGPFEIAPAIYEGPFINKVTDSGVSIWCNTNLPVQTSLEIDGKTYKKPIADTFHQWDIQNLRPNTSYEYTVHYGEFKQQYTCRTAPTKGSQDPFKFGYTSDSRSATGGGERNIFGANVYIMKKIGALANQEKVSFVQFTGDMINGYLNNNEEMQLQYTNWKKSIEPFWHYIPYNVGMGNHEALGYIFRDEAGKQIGFVDKFPYETESAEAAFQEAFVNPENGPVSEDDNKYDPDKNNTDFPSYKENVYYYVHGNVAMIVLNSDYWFAPTLKNDVSTSGGLHGYLLDNQIEWLKKTIEMLEKDRDIDHVFVTQHTPAFPNGGHSGDDMWYSGNNDKRPYIAGKPVEKGIIERRDEYLDILINQSSKVVAILTGDEHNYNYMKITSEVPIYPENYPHAKLNISRPIYQINNGAAGAPYYAQEVLPWSAHTKSFSVENALCIFSVNGKKIEMKVINPDTLNEIDSLELR